MDKISKVKAYLENQKAEYRLGKSAEAKYRMEAYTEILDFINSLQEEPVSGDLEEASNNYAESEEKRVGCGTEFFTPELVEAFKAGSQWQKEQFEKNRLAVCDKPLTFKAIPRLLSMVEPSRKAKSYCEKLAKSLEHEGYLVDAKFVHESIKIMDGEKVPMATMDEEAKQFAEEYSFNIESDLYQTLTDEQRGSWKKEIENAIKVGVRWQTERFENNRVNAFKNQTEEESQIEMDFAVSIIEKEHRTPTFDDAIKYGMKLQQMKDNQDELPKWRYKKDNAPLIRDSIILNKYGCVAKSPSGAIVCDVWVIDYDELAKLPKEEQQ